MNPFKPLITLIKFLLSDLKEDIKTINGIIKGTHTQNFNKEVFKEKDFIKNFLKENWMLFMCCILMFLVGWVMAAKHYQNLANTFILENCVDNIGNMINASTANITFDLPKIG